MEHLIPAVHWVRMATPPVFAMCGVRKVNRFGLVRAEVHGKRGELGSRNAKVRRRVEKRTRTDFDASQPRSFGWSKAGEDRHLDLRAAFDAHCAEHGGVKPWGKSPLALHLLVMVSPQWPAEHGNPYTRDNARVASLVDQATAWADEQIGGVFAVRYDCDERSAGIVDVFCAPIRTPGGNRTRDFIMTNRALTELQHRTEERRSYSAVQTSWAAHCQAHLDPAILRGEYKAQTGAEHVHADTIRGRHEAVEQEQADRADELAELEKRQAEKLLRRAADLDAREAAVARRERVVEKRYAEAAAADQDAPAYQAGYEAGIPVGERKNEAKWRAWLRQLPAKLKSAVRKSLTEYTRALEARRNSPEALRLAAAEGRTDDAQALLDAGVDPNEPGSEGETALMLAGRGGHAAVAAVLLDAGADASRQDKSGRTAARYALDARHPETAEALQDAAWQPEVHAISKPQPPTPPVAEPPAPTGMPE